MKPAWIAAVTLATATVAAARIGRPLPAFTVWLQNGQLAAPTVLGIAQGTAVRIFAQAGVRLEWRTGAPGQGADGRENIEIVLDENAPAQFSPTAMAYATVGPQAVAIHVFYYRVTLLHPGPLAPTLLGHVFAHEITHVLENVARHSAEGVLKAHWTGADFREMARRPLPFAPIDAELVRARFGL